MQSNQQPGSARHEFYETEESPVSIARILRVLRGYLPAILLGTAAVALLYLLGAVIAYLRAPSVQTTALTFRLDFEGAAEGKYPNQLKFSPTDIVATPILLRVHESNGLQRFMPFDRFSRSITVVESNPQYEKLASVYRSRLADPKLSPVDRERIEREFELALGSISKHGYALQYVHPGGHRLPATVVRKVLNDILNVWADVAVNQQHVLAVDAAMVSPQLINDPQLRNGNLITGIQLLHSRVWRISRNVAALQDLPGGRLARTSDQLSLPDIETRLNEIVRFRLEPLIGSLDPALVENRAATIDSLQNQLAYDRRLLAAAQQRAEAIMQTLAVYSREERIATPAERTSEGNGELMTPQLSDTFIDRLVALTSQAADIEYRRELAEDYRDALEAVIPRAEAVAYDEQLIAQMTAPSSQAVRDAQSVRVELAAIQADLHTLVTKMNELYKVISSTLYPTSQLLTVTAPAVSRVERSISISRMLLLGVFFVVTGFVLMALGALLHNRMTEEDAEVAAAGDPAPTGDPA